MGARRQRARRGHRAGIVRGPGCTPRASRLRSPASTPDRSRGARLMPGPSRAGVRKQLQAMATAWQPGATSRVEDAGLAQNYQLSPLMMRSAMGYGMDPALGAPLPRDPRVFLSQFDPNMPQPPMSL